jgi:predicted metal-binding protein
MEARADSVMRGHEELEALFEKHGFGDYRWIGPEKIVVSQWVRMKCTFGCWRYGKSATCPPNLPSVSECERFFREYKEAVVFHVPKKVDCPEDRHVWAKKVNSQLSKLEREVFLSGYQKAFLLLVAPCNICKECAGVKEKCNEPALSRPTPEGMAIDVFSTVRQLDYPIEVLSDYAQEMNRYAFLMIA